jgi:uncharacterized protein YcgI (DUF1989 family)
MAETVMGAQHDGTARIAAGTGHALRLEAGQTLTIALPVGRQVVDLNAFCAERPAERFSASVTRMRHGTHLGAGMSLLSRSPWERPLLTIVRDTLAERLGADARGERRHRPHDLLYPPCSRPYRLATYGEDSDGCSENLGNALARLGAGLGPLDVHDPFNLFMETGVSPAGKLEFGTPSADRGDLVALRAELGVIVALSVCPSGSSGGVPRAVDVTVDAASPAQ